MSRSPASRSRLRRRALIALALVGLPVVLVLCAWLWARSDAAREALLAEVRPRLEARLGPVTIGDTWRVGPRGITLGPVRVQGPGIPAGQAPLLTVERVGVRPRWRSLLRGRVELESVTLHGAVLELGPRASRREALGSLLRGAGEGDDDAPGGDADAQDSRALSLVQLEGARLGLGAGVTLGPASVELRTTRTAQGLLLSTAVAWDEGTATADLGRRAEGGGWHLEASWQALPLAPLVTAVRPGLLHAGRTWGQLSYAGASARFDVTVADAELTWARLSPAPIGPWRVRAKGEASWDEAAQGLHVPALEVLLGSREKVGLELSLTLPTRGEGPFELAAVLPPTSLQELLVALPDELSPRDDVGAIEGPLSATLEASGPLGDRSAWEVEATLDLEALRQQARTYGQSPLASPFVYRPLVAEEARGRVVQVGPQNPFFVPLGEVPHVLVRAVLLSEDSFFYSHPGFDVQSLVKNLLTPKEGPVVRGGSTLTQQLAKNLYLSREKTLARKAREALLTIALEASLPKDRLLEIYLNVIEWGPDVYGLGEAAWHYFGKDARHLTAREAIFLATIIPNPIRYHGYCARNELSPVWEQRMADLITKLAQAGELEPVSEALARYEHLQFQHRPRGDAFFTEPADLEDSPEDDASPGDDDAFGASPDDEDARGAVP